MHLFHQARRALPENIKPRDMLINYQTKSLHHFHAYTAKDRIDFSHISYNAELVCPDDTHVGYGVFCSNDDDGLLTLLHSFLTL